VGIQVEDNIETPYPGYIDLIIENVGNGIAKNLEFFIEPLGFCTLSGDPLDKLFIIQNGIQTLAPKHRYVQHIIQLGERIEELKKEYLLHNQNLNANELRQKLKTDLELKIRVTYEDKEGMEKQNDYLVNLCIFWGLSGLPKFFRRVS